MVPLLLGALLQASTLPAEARTDATRPDGPAIPACEPGAGAEMATTVAALPKEVAAELARFFGPEGGLAEAGGRYNATDVVDSRLPMRRFLRAYHVGAHWIVWYERGGMAAGRRTIALTRDSASPGRTPAYRALPGTVLSGDLCTATKAILAGVRSGNP